MPLWDVSILWVLFLQYHVSQKPFYMEAHLQNNYTSNRTFFVSHSKFVLFSLQTPEKCIPVTINSQNRHASHHLSAQWLNLYTLGLSLFFVSSMYPACILADGTIKLFYSFRIILEEEGPCQTLLPVSKLTFRI